MKPITHEITNDCRPVGEILNQIGGKWTVLTINVLSGGPMRFSRDQAPSGRDQPEGA